MSLDLLVNDFMVLIETSFLKNFAKVISFIFEPEILILASIILSVFIFFKVSKKNGFVFSGAMIVTGLLIKIFKELIQRVRPENMLVAETGFSFPSGHATVSIVFFGLLIAIFSKKKSKIISIIISSILVLLIVFSRIYLRVHWFIDVFGGLVFGGIILVLSLIVLKKK